MTPYERGYAAALKAAAKECEGIGRESKSEHGRMFDQGHEWAAELCENRILSLPIVGEADQRGAASSSEHLAPCSVHDSREAASVPHQNPGEQESLRAVPAMEGSDYKPTSPARPGPSQECVSVPRAALNDIREHALDNSLEVRNRLQGVISRIHAMLAAAEEE